MNTTWTEHGGKKILVVDYRGCKSDKEMIAVLDQEVLIERGLTEKVLVLADFTNVHAGPDYMDAVKKAGKEVRNQKTARTALVGIHGVQKILVNAYISFTGDKNMASFPDQESAKSWLTS